MRSSPNSVTACFYLCLTEASTTIMEVITMGMSLCFALVLRKNGRPGGWKASSLYIACRAFILMTTGAEWGPGMSVKHWASALVVCLSLVSLLPALFRFFSEGSANLSITSKSNPQSPGLERSSSSLSSSEGGLSSVRWVHSSFEPWSLPAPE